MSHADTSGRSRPRCGGATGRPGELEIRGDRRRTDRNEANPENIGLVKAGGGSKQERGTTHAIAGDTPAPAPTAGTTSWPGLARRFDGTSAWVRRGDSSTGYGFMPRSRLPGRPPFPRGTGRGPGWIKGGGDTMICKYVHVWLYLVRLRARRCAPAQLESPASAQPAASEVGYGRAQPGGAVTGRWVDQENRVVG